MATEIKLHGGSGGKDGYRGDLALERDLPSPIFIEASKLGLCHPMFLVRLCLFVEWHLAAGHTVEVRPPKDARVAQQLTDMGLMARLGEHVVDAPSCAPLETGTVLGLRRLTSFHDVEDAAADGMQVLERQESGLALWGGPLHMAISELCDNAYLHGRNDLGTYVAADRVEEPRRQFRLAIADLGIGIPEHIRAQHPEWQDDGAAIARALQRGVTGTGDPHRGNGFSEVLDAAVDRQLVRASSALSIDIRSAHGRVGVEVVGGNVVPGEKPVQRPRRGTWISYTVTSA